MRLLHVAHHPAVVFYAYDDYVAVWGEGEGGDFVGWVSVFEVEFGVGVGIGEAEGVVVDAGCVFGVAG